jgi:hypothetical protein
MSNQVLIATRKGLFHVNRGTSGWKIGHVSFLGDNVTMVMPDARDGSLLAGLNHGHFGVKIQRSTDNGRTWTEAAVPAYPPKPDDADDKDMWGKPLEWKLKLVWALEPGLANEPGVVWCGTLPGGLFRSADSGKSWELVSSLWNHPKRKAWFGGGADLPGIHSICVDPREARRIAVGISCGGVWMTSDGGNTWHCAAEGMRAEYMPPEQQMDPNIQDPHRVVQCPARPEYFWAQHHNGIFRSTDGCVSWQEIKNTNPSAFGFAVVVHPRDPDTAWFVPGIKDEKRIPVDGKVVVTRTRDGGKSFETLRKGLPQEHAYDLVFRHGMDIDASGERLAFGSTTGSCWISEDSGDSWQCLSSNLPPIYCVRFAQS